MTRELEHLSRLTIAWQYWQAEVNVISMCAQQGVCVGVGVGVGGCGCGCGS